MSKVIFKRKNTNEIESLKVQDGSLIFNTETGAIFMDYGTKRISIFDNLYPVGSIIIRDNDIDMSNYLGFTWAKVFAGKVLVGVDSTDNDFKTVGKTGGEKTITHDHGLAGTGAAMIGADWAQADTIAYAAENIGSMTGTTYNVGGTNRTPASQRSHNTQLTGKTNTSTLNNLQPYITCYIWKRTA